MAVRRLIGIAALLLLTAAVPTGDAQASTKPTMIRPGSAIGPCTMGFAFAGSDGRRYISTAGHCVHDEESGRAVFGNGMEVAWVHGDGPLLTDYRPAPFVFVPGTEELLPRPTVGRYVYAIWNQNSLYRASEGHDPSLPSPADFALVQPTDGVRIDPQMCHFGGPVGINASATKELHVVRYVGGGQGVGMERHVKQPIVSARTGVAHGLESERSIRLRGAVGPGDSGMPVTDDDGQALGILGGPDERGGSDLINVMRLRPHVRRAEKMLGIRLRLLRAKVHHYAAPVASAAC